MYRRQGEYEFPGHATTLGGQLLAALVRFEWYFKPPVISGSDRRLVIGGIATERGDLDARRTLNAAAWCGPSS